jgi:hypothetical protein
VIEVENGSPSPSMTGVRESGRVSERLAALSERAPLSADRRSDGTSEGARASRVNACALRARASGKINAGTHIAELVSSCVSGALSSAQERPALPQTSCEQHRKHGRDEQERIAP